MAQRITITIPDGLHERMQVVKERFNISGVCQEAIMRAVATEELKNSDIPEREKLVARLRAQRKEYYQELRESAEEDGRNAAEVDLDYTDFLRVEAARDATNQEEVLGVAIMDWLGESIDLLQREDSAFDRQEYIRGWIDGAMNVWRELKKEL